jgi:NTE family protein
MSNVPTVAIACQGGGSHAAFAAGVLDALLGDEHFPHFHLVGLSGTSGGALCAALAWRGLVKDDPLDGRRRLINFWRDLMVHDPFDAIANYWHVWSTRAPIKLEVSPYLYEPIAENRLRSLLQTHLQLDELRSEPGRQTEPLLLVGATDVLNGDRIVFRGGSLTYDSLLASAAVPPLFRAIRADGRVYWDGLFTTNPPVREFTDLRDQVPDEVWVIQVNPQRREQEPRTTGAIIDRMNELSGNLSLGQELFFLDKINGLLEKHPALAERYKKIRIRVVALPDAALDLASKYDRRAEVIEGLLERGRKQAAEFFGPESEWPRADTIPCKSVSALMTPKVGAPRPGAEPPEPAQHPSAQPPSSQARPVPTKNGRRARVQN